MDTYKTYTERILTPTPTILGLRLYPFTLGHSLLLKGVNSKFINGEYNKFLDVNTVAKHIVADFNLIPEFVLALLICSTTYDEFKDEVNNGELGNVINILVADIKTAKVNFIEKIHAFAHYLKQGTDLPLYYNCEDKNTVKTTPIELEEAVLSTLMTNCGYTRNECLNLPMTETLSAYLLYAHSMGSIELIGKDVFDLTQKLKAGK